MRAQRSREFTDVEHARAAPAEGGEDTLDLGGIELDAEHSHPVHKLRPVDIASRVPCLEDGHNLIPLRVIQLTRNRSGEKPEQVTEHFIQAVDRLDVHVWSVVLAAPSRHTRADPDDNSESFHPDSTRPPRL